ncbi:DMT family transporter [Salipiger marinus]|jgi:bacterial/archaeal transporter family-2 protein|uniref:Transporter family-2 protein n=1 Tax=Salipiger marinus TaxID=555512 RepID=A0A1G8JNL6_9RHOB|nr:MULTISPECIES: DMT family transporter [Salipiger]HBM57899.1 EamA-like transporter family protein [Citreicella sp.]MCD1619985.1 DMT family transporter [Salipiger manganoxidans]MEB3420932.1 DMT family transporter [Salipiger manganoxidans]SDI32673.1 transporter family-2 protein [Salipiger marinus]HBT02591.1 EamA-like transporter family protein [Citreicella sp.]
MPSQALIMLAAGIGIPILAALNARLGGWMGSPAGAAVILFCVALAATTLVLLVLEPRALVRAMDAPRHLFLGGLFVAFYVLAVTYVAPSFGVGRAVFFVLLGQLISAALIDHFGLFGARIAPVTLNRLAGIALMGAGVFLAQRG